MCWCTCVTCPCSICPSPRFTNEWQYRWQQASTVEGFRSIYSFCLFQVVNTLVGSKSNDLFERRASTRSSLFEFYGRDFEQILGQIVSVRVKTLSNINLVASRHINREKGSLPIEVRPSKTSLLKLPINWQTELTDSNNSRAAVIDVFCGYVSDHLSINHLQKKKGNVWGSQLSPQAFPLAQLTARSLRKGGDVTADGRVQDWPSRIQLQFIVLP